MVQNRRRLALTGKDRNPLRRILWITMACGLVLSGQRPAEAVLGLLTCPKRLESCSNNLAECNAEQDSCSSDLSQLQAELNSCQSDLAACEAEPDFAFPASGQTTAYLADKNDGVPGEVPVPDDGTVQAGASLSYTDNGDGTITDHNTGLMWEQKTADGSLHDALNTYVWSGDGSQETIWDWLAALNATNFAGYNDWRIPNVKELQSIVDYERLNPCIDPVFGITVPFPYWSATTFASTSPSAWFVNFRLGDMSVIDKTERFLVRAVRGGS